jgi:3-oxoadipate enol-lactonase
MQTVISGGIALHVRDEGPKDGRVVMFANSLGTDLRVWDALLARLPAGLRLVRFDKRGHGLSDCPDAPYAMETLIADAETVAEALDLQDITFVGLSIGGLIGQSLAAKRPDLVRALVIMDSAARIGTEEMWRERISALRSGGIDSMVDAILKRWFAPRFRNDPRAVTPWRNMLTRTPLEGYIGCCHAIAETDLTEQTRSLSLPVMALVGEADGSTTPEIVRATADLCGAPCNVIQDAAHIPCVEKPAEVAALLAAFLKEA